MFDIDIEDCPHCGGTLKIIAAILDTVLDWTGFLQVNISKWPALTDYMGRVVERPTVIEAIRKEELIKWFERR